jgi:hypothetical protein
MLMFNNLSQEHSRYITHKIVILLCPNSKKASKSNSRRLSSKNNFFIVWFFATPAPYFYLPKASPCFILIQKKWQDNSSRLSVVILPFRETGKPPLFVPVFRDVSHNLCDEKAIRISFSQLLLYAA